MHASSRLPFMKGSRGHRLRRLVGVWDKCLSTRGLIAIVIPYNRTYSGFYSSVVVCTSYLFPNSPDDLLLPYSRTTSRANRLFRPVPTPYYLSSYGVYTLCFRLQHLGRSAVPSRTPVKIPLESPIFRPLALKIG